MRASSLEHSDLVLEFYSNLSPTDINDAMHEIADNHEICSSIIEAVNGKAYPTNSALLIIASVKEHLSQAAEEYARKRIFDGVDNG